jgi:IgA Peptidase M64/Secretion system C-terminal sorting domain
MRKRYLLPLFLLLFYTTFHAQVFDVETIQYKGDPNKFINIVILGDGYTASEQNTFIAKATELSDYLFSQSPWSNYKDYFNVYAVKVISLESGAKHPNSLAECATVDPFVPTSNPNNYFGSSFDRYNVHRLIVPTNTAAIASVLAANLPNYDQVIILANTPYYGGSGGTYSTLSTNIQSNEIGAHELGHSFASLADEYYAGDIYFAEKPNMTNQTDPALIKWKNWLNVNQIGVFSYCCGGNSSLWRKPATGTCKMEYLNNEYCSVCKEGIIEKIHVLTNPIVSYTPETSTINSTSQLIDFSFTELMKPIPNTLTIKWELDGTTINPNSESVQINQTTLSIGTHILTATVTDNASLINITNHATTHFDSVTWSINRGALGVNWQTKETSIGLSLFPNPTTNFVTVHLELAESSFVSIDLVSMEGRIIQSIPAKEFSAGENNSILSTENLSQENYIIALKINGVNYSKTLIKE